MKLIIIHYHLNPGGVTRIIESQIRGFLKINPETEIILMTGKGGEAEKNLPSGVTVIKDPLIDYLENREYSRGYIKEKYTGIYNLLLKVIGKEDILHCHNSNLGKNPLLSMALYQLADEGFNIIHHCHDFPEDRAENLKFFRKILADHFQKDYHQVAYPGFSNIFYIVLNSFDFDRLKNYSIHNSNLFLLPNPVNFNMKIQAGNKREIKQKVLKSLHEDPSKILVTYPVRVIKRKNIGEFILLASLFSETITFTVTQPPKNPVEIKEYEEWKVFCRSNNCKVVFDSGLKVNFEELILASDFCITTSIREGFGMTYLEPWLLDTPVIGRDLPMVTVDLQNEGIVFTGLYEKINVNDPSGLIDFKELSVCEQKDYIKKIIHKKGKKEELLDLNPFLKDLFKPVPDEIVEKNKKTIKTKYSIENYAERLESIYKKFTDQTG